MISTLGLAASGAWTQERRRQTAVVLWNTSCYNHFAVENGLWRSLVARYLGVVEVVGSNPASPTI